MIKISQQQLIKKFKNAQRLYALQKGNGEVVGQEIDEENRMWYVVKEGNELILKRPKDCQIVPTIYSSPGKVVKIVVPIPSSSGTV